MKINKKSVVYFIVLLGLVILFLFAFYGRVIMSPNSFLFSQKGDGIKNYYTYAYYIENNKSNTNFEGMNYPYGENIMYTDCHPILAFMLKILNQFIPGISNYSIGILNLLLILSMGITAIIIYFIFKELKVNKLLSVLGAMGIMALSSQIFRITGHYALSYSFFIPLTIYLLLLYEKGLKRKKIFFFLTISILFFFSVHAYLGMIASTLVFTYLFVSIINQLLKEKRINVSKHLWMLVSALLPVALYYLFVKITDIHTGRTTNPWGILENYADYATVFLPIYSPLDKIKEYFFPGVIQTWEGWSYIGLSTIIVLFCYLMVSVKSSIKTRTVTLDKTWIDNVYLRQLFIASLIILAFSMFMPFRFHLEKLINHFDIIKQFRALGRFAWVFYFVSTIMLVYIINKISERLLDKKRYVIAYALIVFVPLSLFCEGLNYHNYISKELTLSSNQFDIKQASESLKKDTETINPFQYQAILPFPFFHFGSENYGKTANDKIYKLSYLYSYHLGLPILGGSLVRASIGESKNIMQLFASNFYSKNIQKDLPNDKPFLLICLNDSLNSVENDYLNKAKLIVKRDEFSLYEISPAAFFENTAAKEMEQFNGLKDQLFAKNGFLVSDTSLYFKFIDYEKPATDISFSGKNGCYSGLQRDYNTIFSIEKGKLQLNKKYTARFWMYNNGENYGQDCLGGMIFFQKTIGEKKEWLKPIVSAGNSREINDRWSLVELSFEHTDNEATYDLIIKGSDISEKTIYLDDLLFYDNELVIYKLINSRNKKTLFRNNHRIEFSLNNKE